MIAGAGRRLGRSFAVLIASVLVTLFAALPLGTAAAQEASPVATAAAPNPFAETGLPEITITARETIFAPKVPGALLEGWYIINLVNETNKEANANLALLPEGQTVGALSSIVSTAFQGEGGQLPDWWASTKFAGGNVAAPGATTHTLAYLTPGKWAIFSINPGATQSPSVFTVLTPAEAESAYGIKPEASPVASPVAAGRPAPAGVTAGATIDLSDTAIAPQGEPPAAGPVIAKVTNTGEQVHDLILVKTDQPMDEAALKTLATSYAKGETLSGATVVGVLGTLGPGETAYFATTLEAGNYAFFSSMPDTSGGLQADKGLVLPFAIQ